MDYLVFITGLFFLISGAGGLFLFRKDHCVSRWPLFFLLCCCLAAICWFPILSFAFAAPESLRIIPVLLGATAASASLAFSLSPLSDSSRFVFLAKWVLVIGSFVLCASLGSANDCSPFYITPILLSSAFAGWRSCSFCNELYHRHKTSHQALPALLLAVSAAVCLLPESAAFAYDTHGLGFSPERAWRIAGFTIAAITSASFAILLWNRFFRPGKQDYSHLLRRRRSTTTAVLLATAIVTLLNGAWFASWIGNTSRNEQVSTLLSALKLGTSTINPSLVQSISGIPEDVHSPAFKTLRSNLVNIFRSIPNVRFTYLLGLRNQQLVFLVDAEDPSNTEDFSPPGMPVHDYPKRWQPELAGSSTFNGPDRDEWGVWFSAAVPVFSQQPDSSSFFTDSSLLNKNLPPNPNVVAILGVDFPANLWLQPVAARRIASMGITLSVAILITALFAFQLLSIERSSRIDQLTDRLRDAMQAADFDVWECFLNPFKIILGEHITASLGWPTVSPRTPFRRIWCRIHPEDRDQLLNLTRQDSATETDVRLKNQVGQWIWFSLRGHVVAANGDTPLRIVGIIVNIDDTKRMQLDLDRQQQLARSVMASVPQGLVVTDSHGSITFANPAMAKLTHASVHQLVGTPIHQWLPLPEPLLASSLLESDETLIPFETSILSPNQPSTPVKVFRTPLSAAGPAHQQMFSVVDLSSIRETEKQLRASRAEADRLALVAKRTDNAVIITDPEGCIEWVNEGFSRMSGYSREEAIGRPPGSFLQKDDYESSQRAHMREQIRSGQGFVTEVINTHKSGSPYTAHIECQPLTRSDGSLSGFMAIVRDVTQARLTTRLLEATASIGNTLLSLPISQDLWNSIVSTLGSSANSHRCTLFRIQHHEVTNAPCASQIAEWKSPNFPSHIQNSVHQQLHLHDHGLRHAFLSLSSNKEISGPVSLLPEPERSFFSSIGTVSICSIPIFAGDEFWGFINIDDCIRERSWEPWEISIFKSTAANIGLRQVVQHESDALVHARNQAFEAAAAADKANLAKSTFLATMSHEIRTPLNAVIGMASLLETTPLNHQQKDFAATILNSSNFLLELINDILDYSRIESGHIDLDSSRFQLDAVCRNAFEVIRPSATGKQLELICRIPTHLPNEFQGDSARIRQILVNLLSNAVKFTHSGFVSLIVDGTLLPNHLWNLSFEVKDSGIGIASDAQQRLFKPFVQEDSSTTRRFGGSGLGLAISKRLAAIMGGDISVQSVQGQGSTFTVTIQLPIASEISSHRPVHFSVPKDSHLNILIVDDNELNRRILEETLASWGLPCHSAANAPGAIRLWKQNGPYNLVISDHHMPDMDGVELTQYLRSLPNSESCRFTLLSSESNYSQNIRSIFDEVGPKPIWPSAIQSMLGRLFPGIVTEDAKSQKSPDHFDATDLEKLKILVAEDNLNNQKVIRLLLRRLGIDPHMADNGQIALEAAQSHSFDVILLDIQMPVMDGLEACRAIRQLELPTRPYIVALTANVFQEDRETAFEAGMDDYLSKPITLARLRETLSHVLKHSQIP